jgi:hypothetical protein
MPWSKNYGRHPDKAPVPGLNGCGTPGKQEAGEMKKAPGKRVSGAPI